MSEQESAAAGSGPEAPPAPKGGRNVAAAVITGAVLLGYIISSLIWFNWGFVIFFALALSVGVLELNGAARRVGLHPAWQPVLIGTPLVVLLSYWYALRGPEISEGLTVILAGLALTTLATMMWRMRAGVAGYLKDTAAGLFIIAYLPLLGSTVGLMLADAQGPRRVVVYLLCVVACDTAAYVFGSLLGKHRLAPRISPGKTWEGFIAGVIAAALAGAFLVKGLLAAPWWVGVILGAALAATAAMGDLIESMVKRDAGLKDMSRVLPGHGGAMDRLDSLLVAAPVAWMVMYFLVPR